MRRPLAPALVALHLLGCGDAGPRPDPPALPEFPALPSSCPEGPSIVAAAAYKIDREGYLDADVDLAALFTGAFTLTAWVMPEYTFNDHGPIFASASGGFFTLGQGDYREGNGGYMTADDPVLHLRVGDRSATYLAPNYQRRSWNHVALVHAIDGGRSIFHLFVNGERLAPIVAISEGGDGEAPAPELAIDGPLLADDPPGPLRIGRRRAGATQDDEAWQLYAIVDEVAAFDRALADDQLLALLRCGLRGDEDGLIVGFPIDDLEDPAATPRLGALVVPEGLAGARVTRVTTRDRKWEANADNAIFTDEALASPTTATYRLPFAPGEAWRVIQEPDSRGGSHNGYAAFCWDFVRDEGSSSKIVYRASAPGSIIRVIDDLVPAPDEREGNSVTVRAAEREHNLYLHDEPGSFVEIFRGGAPLVPGQFPQDDPAYELPIAAGDPIARTGDNAAHLHFDASDGFVTQAMAFSEYERWDEDARAWRRVARGVPRLGDVLRLPP
ncbi:MAG: LamG-like jellyroll fold domain-containing protein [Nannocystaceae bacterium]